MHKSLFIENKRPPEVHEGNFDSGFVKSAKIALPQEKRQRNQNSEPQLQLSMTPWTASVIIGGHLMPQGID